MIRTIKLGITYVAIANYCEKLLNQELLYLLKCIVSMVIKLKGMFTTFNITKYLNYLININMFNRLHIS